MNIRLFAFLYLSVAALGQGSVVTGTPVVSNPLGQPLPGATVAVCNADPGSPSTGGCVGHLATLYTDITLVTPCTGSAKPLSNPGGAGSSCSNPGTVDGSGNAVAFGATGQFWCEYYGGGISGVKVIPCIFPVTASAGSFSFTGLSVTNAGVFTDTQQNDYATSDINSLNISSEYSGVAGGHKATEGLVGAVAVPGSSTVWQANGIAGYVTNSSTTTQAVGVVGIARSVVANSAAIAANFVTQGTTGVGNGHLTDAEFDFNPKNATDTGTAVSTVYGTTVQSNGANANLCSTAHPGVAQWSTCLLFDTGATTGGTASAALVFKPVATGNSQVSQSIDFQSTDAGGLTKEATLDEDATGLLRLRNATGFNSTSKFNSSAVGNGTSGGMGVISAGAATLDLKDTTQGADAKLWDFVVGLDANTLRFRAVNDAENSALSWLTVTRTGVATATAAFLATVSATNAVLTTPTLTGLTNGTGLQLFNTTTTCTTGAAVGAICTTAAITLPVAYADTNYRAHCTGLGPTNVPIVQTVAKSNTTFTITIAALTAAAATFSSYDCMVGHN